jgi:phenylpropionate dioxygenase-like ring-hydroxylating dioxygenase large terminal subunit
MGMLDHWHPVCPSKDVGAKPVGVKLCGRLLCVYRTDKGEAACVDDVCPHRRLRLSYGKVIGDRIQCKYHGWTFDPCGNGESPGTPKMTTCTDSFATREAHGYVWVKSRQSAATFPDINPVGFYNLGHFRHVVPAPLELTVDNFNEIEHSGTVHDTFGYDLDRMHEVRVRFEATDTTVRVVNAGPTKTLFRPFRWLLGVRQGDTFHDDWTTHFSPVYSVFDHWWTSPDETREGKVRWKIYIFYCPIDAENTAVVSFAYAKSTYPGPTGGMRLAWPLLRWEIDREIRQDIQMLTFMADKSPGLDGMKLSRFDKVLGLTRERINKVYRGEPAGRVSVVA